jgi:hypothetical protein
VDPAGEKHRVNVAGIRADVTVLKTFGMRKNGMHRKKIENRLVVKIAGRKKLLNRHSTESAFYEENEGKVLGYSSTEIPYRYSWENDLDMNDFFFLSPCFEQCICQLNLIPNSSFEEWNSLGNKNAHGKILLFQTSEKLAR